MMKSLALCEGRRNSAITSFASFLGDPRLFRRRPSVTNELNRAKQQDPPLAWTELTSRLRPFIQRRVSENDAEDILQDVLLRMHNGLPKLREREQLAPWMFRIARNAIADHLRKRARNPARPAPRDEPPLEQPALPLDETAITESLAGALDSLIERLPEKYQSAIRLTELEGRSQQEMADVLGLSLSGAKSRVQRGREKLRDLIESCCRIALDSRGKLINCEPRTSNVGSAGCCD